MPHAQSKISYATGTSRALAFDSNVAAGSAIVVILVRYGGSACTGVSDGTNTYNRIETEQLYGADNASALDIWVAYNVAGGATTVTASYGSSTGVSMIIGEYSSVTTTNPVDQTARAENTNTSSASSGNTGTLGQADEIVIGALAGYWSTNISITAGSGFTGRQSYTDGSLENPIALEDKIVSATTAVAATATLGTNTGWMMRCVTLRISSGPANPQPNVSDAVAVSESRTIDMPRTSSQLDAVTVAESVARTLISLLSTSEGVALAESITAAMQAGRVSAGESTTVAESINVLSGTPAVNVTDAVSLSEAIQALLFSLAGASEAVTLADTTTVRMDRGVNAADSVAVAEAVAQLLGSFASASDSASVAETVTVSVVSISALQVNVTDAMTIGETVGRLESSNVNVADAAAVAETVAAVTGTARVNAGDSVTVTESTSLIVTIIGTFQISVADTVATAESINAVHPLPGVIAGDGIATSEQAGVAVSTARVNISDAVVLAETTQARVPIAASATEAVLVVDSAGIAALALITIVAEGVTVSEATSIFAGGSAPVEALFKAMFKGMSRRHAGD